MNQIEIPERKIKLEVPAHWDEMTAVQARYCLKQAVLAASGIIDPEEARVRCLYYLLDIERDSESVRKELLLTKRQREEKFSRIALLCEELITFLFADNGKGQLEINYTPVLNHFPQVKAGKVVLYGPSHLLADLTFGELRAAVEEMQAYFDSRGEDQLSRMIACLYRPERKDWESWQRAENYDGRRREPFNRARIEDLALITARLGKVERTGILLWFSHSLQYIQSEDLMISGREINLSPLFPQPVQEDSEPLRPDQRGAGWTGVLFQLAEQKVFGEVDKADRTGFFDILVYMYEKHLENQKAKAKQKKK
ncbi:hypothetical protein [uncultured Algoriphagus sp.]|uniref:hypothetical protein n=1 Tax=uncultured Algoriphagus sp. TaxID=417365 RepID=UPI00258D2FE1|nr:hypothetical protein [uncultured Algoriphagus sp.]